MRGFWTSAETLAAAAPAANSSQPPSRPTSRAGRATATSRGATRVSRATPGRRATPTETPWRTRTSSGGAPNRNAGQPGILKFYDQEAPGSKM